MLKSDGSKGNSCHTNFAYIYIKAMIFMRLLMTHSCHAIIFLLFSFCFDEHSAFFIVLFFKLWSFLVNVKGTVVHLFATFFHVFLSREDQLKFLIIKVDL